MKEAFLKHFNLTENDMSILWAMFMDYGMNGNPDLKEPHRTKGNHYFLQGIGQYHSVEWETWVDHLSPYVKQFIEQHYPQLMVQNREFET